MRSPRSRARWAAPVLFLLLGGLGFAMAAAVPATAGPTSSAVAGDPPSDLRGALAASETGTVRVIVTMALDVKVEAQLSTTQREAQRAAIGARQDLLGELLAGTGSRVLTRYKVAPSAVVVLDDAGLDTLVADPRVAALTLDRAFPLALAESTGIIGSTALNAAGVTGENYNGSAAGRFEVAVLDSGVDLQHPAFEDRIVAQACYSYTGECPDGQPVQTGGEAGQACGYAPSACSHGTHVAGIAVGATYDGGHAGVAPKAGLVPVQVGHSSDDCPPGEENPCWRVQLSDLDRALEHVLSLKQGGRNLVAVNLSLGGLQYSTSCAATYPSTQTVVDNLYAASVAVVAAAGNDGSRTSVSYPACLNNVYAVSATTDADAVAGFSNWGALTDWLAPGVDIDAPVPTPTTTGRKSGTSMAAPHVSGAMALLRQCVDGFYRPITLADAAGDLTRTGKPVTTNGVTRPRIDVLEAATSNVNNNDFGAAEVVSPVVGPIGSNDPDFNICADAQPGEPAPFTVENSVWWSWTPWTTGNAVIHTATSASATTTFDTELALYTGSSLADLSLVDWNDDASGASGGTSRLARPVKGGTTYWIQVDGKDAQTGLVNLHVALTPTCNGLAATHSRPPGSDPNVTGTAGNDVIVTGAASNVINGLGGNDVICSGSGNDTIDAGDGNDVVLAGDGADIVRGGIGDDTLYGDRDEPSDQPSVPGNDALFGGDGSDTVSYATAPAAVTVDLGAGTATGEGTDTLDGIEHATGSPFADTLAGSSGTNALEGGPGGDTLYGRGGADALSGSGGDDTLTGAEGNDTLGGGAGDDTLSGGEGNDALDGGSDADTLTGGDGDDTLTGGDGSDTINYAAALAPVTVDLSAGTASGEGADTLSGIENATGSAFGDTLLGSSDPNTLDGGPGDDTLDGRGGDDTLRGSTGADALTGGEGGDTLTGGDGSDTASYATAPAPVTVDLTAGTATGEGTDTLSGIENATGSPFADTLLGSSDPNTLDGGPGDDTLDGRGGDDTLRGSTGADALTGGEGGDTLSGGDGSDTASYATAPAPVTVDLAAGTATGDGADTLSGIENATGSAFGDTLLGDDDPNTLTGGNGDDTLTGRGGDDTLTGGAGDDSLDGGPGNDILDGGEGTDTASYATAPAGVRVHLGAETASGGAGSDTVRLVERVTGSAYSDVLTGSTEANVLTGGGGNDTLAGLVGNDTLSGGPGSDTVSFAASAGRVVVRLASGTATGEGSDRLGQVEHVVGSRFADVLNGSALANRLTGGAGNDILRGGGGNDALIGLGGSDALFGGPGNDVHRGGPGRDRCVGGPGRDRQFSCEVRRGIP